MTDDDGPSCCGKCEGPCPSFIKHPRPFKLRAQLLEHNVRMPDSVLKVEYKDKVEEYGPFNSPLMVSYYAGLSVGHLVAQGVDVREIECWIEPTGS